MNFHASLTRQKWKCRMVGVFRGSRGRHRMVVGPLQFVPITPTVVSSNPVHGEVYSIQHYISSTNKTDRHDASEILLQVALYTINLGVFKLYEITTRKSHYTL